MEVILLEDIDTLGHVGDIVKVKDGYVRNYLMPRNLVMPCTKHNKNLIEEKKRIALARREKEKQQYEKLAEKIGAVSCTIAMQAGEEDKLFGSVTNADIQKALAGEGIDIDKKKIEIAEPIKKLGVYSISINLYPEIKATLKVWVVKE